MTSFSNALRRRLSSLADFSFKPCTAPMSSGFTWHQRKSVQLHLRFAAAGGVGQYGDGRVARKLSETLVSVNLRFRIKQPPRSAGPPLALRPGPDAFIPNLEEVRAPELRAAFRLLLRCPSNETKRACACPHGHRRSFPGVLQTLSRDSMDSEIMRKKSRNECIRT